MTPGTNGAILDYARRYRSAGISVIPIRLGGSKRPAVPEWTPYETQIAGDTKIAEWFHGRKLGMAGIGGAVSGNLECLDCDCGELFEPFRELVNQRAPGLMDRLTIVQTPRDGGGYQIHYRCPDVVIPGNTALAWRPEVMTDGEVKRRVTFETRGEGGYFLLPGSPGECHKSGREYRHISGPPSWDPPTITADERSVLWRAAEAQNQCFEDADVADGPKSSTAGSGKLRPGDDYNERGPDWADILGWELVSKRGETRYWRRPGKDDDGWSATTGFCTSKNGVELLAVFSTNGDPFTIPAGKKCGLYSKFAAYTLLKHKGDFAAAAKALVKEGYGDQSQKKSTDGEQDHGTAWEPEEDRAADKPADKPKSGFRFAPIDSPTFFTTNYKPTWLVQRLLVAMQPAMCGGAQKTLKTSLLIALVVALGSGVPFLGRFKVYKQLRVAILSGESGDFTIQETARRICHASGIDPATPSVHWGFTLPQFANAGDMTELSTGLKAHGIEVAIIDPLYLCALAGLEGKDIEAANVFEMGPLLKNASDACLSVCCTPIIVHHAKKSLSGKYEPLELQDLAYAASPEFARQWWLMSRRKKYEPGTGLHRLWFSVGGSVGHGGLWGLDIDEGVLDDEFGGRKWDLNVLTAEEANAEDGEEEAEATGGEKHDRLKRQVKDDGTKLLGELDRLDPNREGVGYTRLRDILGLSGARMTRAVDDLAKEGIIQEFELIREIGSKTTRKVKGIRRKPKTELL